ncbi:hypothetical protein GSI_11053 [Ganoderma sinense ZZ0214-1]|uniref:Uncharacterized protein n=1 Tax=Ganoderma sinense ZZ0214-1 TaxID=1077348 RepID=A0A2G8RZC4_9APHY|nr:hypothetical protein GSI_11053 [Ganoderma sinense ZZ0214-1]
MLDTITYLGLDDAFVSVVENYSTDSRTPDLESSPSSRVSSTSAGCPGTARILVQNETVARVAGAMVPESVFLLDNTR